jgi:hypothetical protein
MLFCGATSNVAFSNAGSHIRSVSVFERHITKLQGLKKVTTPNVKNRTLATGQSDAGSPFVSRRPVRNATDSLDERIGLKSIVERGVL